MRSGFSLVELSIVLVILGLLTGGILTGQNLIRAAELRSVATELSKYQTAIMTFRDKYFALPGDMPNATDFWGEAHATHATCITTEGTGTETCNGNGNGEISANSGTDNEEVFQFWEHLANAGLIEGTYTGIAGSGGPGDPDPGSNIPLSKLNPAAWYVRNLFPTGSTALYQHDYGNALMFGLQASPTNWPSAPTLTTSEAWGIDKKIYDGNASGGKVWGTNFTTCSDATNRTDYKNYDLIRTGLACGLILKGSY